MEGLSEKKEYVFALAGNPNVGKSTLFNKLTGLNQHTGNWTGKTVENAKGRRTYRGENFTLMDLPGTYSIMSSSPEEETARDYICFGGADAVIVVADATALERNFNLLFQIMEITTHVLLCVNLLDEADKKHMEIDTALLSEMLSIPVIGITARDKRQAFRVLEAAKRAARNAGSFKIDYGADIEAAAARIETAAAPLCADKLNPRFAALKLLSGDPKIKRSMEEFLGAPLPVPESFDGRVFTKTVAAGLSDFASAVAAKTVVLRDPEYYKKTLKIDKILTSKRFGIPIMLGLLGLIFYLTIVFANYPSQLLANLFGAAENGLNNFFKNTALPEIIRAPLMDGVYKTTAWVVAVMLPPMAIFFPLFTFLEDLGYLPRAAFNLDSPFRKCGCSGKQSLTMCMGFGCNAAGVVGARIIDSPRERLIAVLTNNFVPCNGRFPTLIAVSGFFIGGAAGGAFLGGLISASALCAVVLVGILSTFAVSALLNKTLLKGTPSSFGLELPPYRKPEIKKVLLRSLIDRTAAVLLRAVAVAAPAGLLIWLLGNVTAGGGSILSHIISALTPLGNLMGLDGNILAAFILGFPANEIVLPVALMTYSSASTLTDFSSVAELGALLSAHGWTWLTGVNMLIFTLFHFPCATTVLTIKKETGSVKWTLLAALIPTAIGIAACTLFTAAVGLFI